MQDTFDDHEYKRKLIAGGIPPGDAAALAARTAAARRESGTAEQETKPAEKERPAKRAGPAQPAKPLAPATERRQTFFEAVAQHVNGLASERKSDMTAKHGKTATDTLAVTVEQAQDAALLKHTKEQMKSLQLSLFDLAPWGDNQRGMPNDFARSALFTVRNKRAPRRELKDEVLFHVMRDVRMSYTGEELRAYDDELVFLQVLEYAKRVPVGEVVTFTLYEFCKDLGWPVNGQYYKRVEDCLTRLTATAVKFSSKRVGKIAVSLIRKFGFLEQSEKRKSRCWVLLEEEMVLFFAGGHYAKVVWEKYRKLSAITRRMFDYFSTHKEPFPLALDTFKQMCASDVALAKKWREQANDSCAELQKSGLVKGVWIKDDLVYCER